MESFSGLQRNLLGVQGSPSDIYDHVVRSRLNGLAAYLLRGEKMRSTAALFDEFAAALQFPPYFGQNWSALDECLSDLDWLPLGTGLVLAVSDALDVLSDSADPLDMLVRRLTSAAEIFAQPIDLGEDWDRPSLPFSVLLQTDGDLPDLITMWEAAGATVQVIGRESLRS